MSDDVKMILTGTGMLIALAWVLTNASAVNTVTTSLATNYSTAVAALRPAA